jgi:hypothetical protein
MNPNNGILNLRKNDDFIKKNIYYLQIIAFDWGEPIGFETIIDIRINLLSRLVKRDLERRKNKSILSSLTIPEERFDEFF